MLKITVITVTYNCVQALAATVDSVLSHEVENVEYLIIDGASTDGTLEIIKKCAAHDQRIKWRSEPDEGIYDAMNKGWEMAHPDSHILYIGAGDKMLSLPEERKAYSPDTVIHGDVLKGDKLFHSRASFELRFANTLHHQALLVPKRLHLSPPFDTNFKIYADFDFNQRLLKAGAEFTYSPTFRSYAMCGGVSCRKDRLELFKVIRKNYGYIHVFLSILTIPWRRLRNRQAS